QQFHWHNQGYGCFDDFLGSLNSRHRKAIKRERATRYADQMIFEGFRPGT
ncbi:MAG TPA: peptidogalycan biosysnthesis protein, partial [Bradyrhizobium sp.]|nr:peptidogalycan biosysnthesis protein [Bradyrhizobium sp.]